MMHKYHLFWSQAAMNRWKKKTGSAGSPAVDSSLIKAEPTQIDAEPGQVCLGKIFLFVIDLARVTPRQSRMLFEACQGRR